ncbi:hypothetical protein ACFPVS_02630 [Neisseria weixii]|uniref:hypothetical protein n=1 Tax=Neisseria weixii TaxID=1853276 RepID=UPI000BB6CB49|nr:hypothetical protein [Neisseria weixii]ATD64973.1 hypothetical protein CGZ65_05880 [Neisseria weixii]
MRMKLSKAHFGGITQEAGNEIRISDGGFLMPIHLRAGRHTRSDFVADNVSTADVECLVMRFGESGVLVAGRDKRFRRFDGPMWRE